MRSIYQAGQKKRRQVQSPFQGRGSSGGGGGGGASRGAASRGGQDQFRNIWGTGGNEGNFAGFEFDRWQALQRAGKDPSRFAQGVEDRFRGERRGIEDRRTGENRRRWDLNRGDDLSQWAGQRSNRERVRAGYAQQQRDLRAAAMKRDPDQSEGPWPRGF